MGEQVSGNYSDAGAERLLLQLELELAAMPS